MISREISQPISGLTTGAISHPSQYLLSYERTNVLTNRRLLSHTLREKAFTKPTRVNETPILRWLKPLASLRSMP